MRRLKDNSVPMKILACERVLMFYIVNKYLMNSPLHTASNNNSSVSDK